MAVYSEYVSTGSPYLTSTMRVNTERRFKEEKRKQAGIAFPSALSQEHLLIIRFHIVDNISGDKEKDKGIVRQGLKNLCSFLDKIEKDKIKLDQILEDGDIIPQPLSKFGFSSTIGFGVGFFDKLGIAKGNRPMNIKRMPDNDELGDTSQYTLLQTDFIIQLGADEDYVNRWVFQNSTNIQDKKEKRNLSPASTSKTYALEHLDGQDPQDIFTALIPWAKITDIHAGFQRLDGKNLLGFNDGISNPDRLSNNVVWTTAEDEKDKFKDGTYMVFQKIEHDLARWQNMKIEKQEQWIGRSKATGLLLGTLPRDQDRKLASDMHSDNLDIRESAMKKWKTFYDQQQDPERRFFDSNLQSFKNIQKECPVWSHVRKANPRQVDGAAKSLIYRRGYLYIDSRSNGTSTSGLLFVCFQRSIEKGFEYIKKNFLNNKNFPVPEKRPNFNIEELRKRHRYGLFTQNEIRELKISEISTYNDGTRDIEDTQNTGKDGLSGPSENGIYPGGQFPITTTHGGGYYFIPPIPNKNIAQISEQFFY